MYQADPNNSKKQIPKARSVNAYGKAVNPPPTIITNRPNYILVNTIGNYSFAYVSGSLSTYVSGSKIENAAGGPVRLDINPVAWTSNGGVAGDITFVYLGDVG
jgi:hypothetical protein